MTIVKGKFPIVLVDSEAIDQAKILKALSDPTRLQIINLLSQFEGEVCVYEIVESFSLEQPTISHHLKVLREAKLIYAQRKGLFIYYHICRDRINEVRNAIQKLIS